MLIRFSKILLTGIALLLLSTMPSRGQQSGGELRDQISSAQAEIERINRLVDTTRAKHKTTLTNLRLVEGKIGNRRKIVGAIESSITSAGDSIRQVQSRATELETELSDLKASYSKLIVATYKTMRNNSILTLLLSSQDFLEASRRLHYVKQIRVELEKRALEISAVRDTLSGVLIDLDGRRKKLTELERDHQAEVTKLSTEQQQLTTAQKELKGREAKLIAEAEAYRRRVTDMEAQLRRIVEQEMSGAKAGTGSAVTSDAFAAQRGKLPRPVDGAVVDRYGEHEHPTRKGVKVNNKGINFAVSQSASARVVFDGEVRKVFFFQGLGNSVMVRHGNYLTIYANLATVNVREGDKITRGTQVGTVATLPGGESIFHFELWNESENLNPEPWLTR